MLIFDLSSEKAIELAERAMKSAGVMLEHDFIDAALERIGHSIHLLGLVLKEQGHNDDLLDLPSLALSLDEAVALLRTLIDAAEVSS